MCGTVAESIIPFITAMLGCLCLASALEGYLLEDLSILFRVVCGIAALLLINTGTITDIIGICLLAIVFMAQYAKKKKKIAAQ